MSLEYLRDWKDDDAVRAELCRFKGVGPKTASCVMLFELQRQDFPVDTHVWHIAKRLRWVPKTFDRIATYEALNRMVPPHIKFDLHVLLVEHGKRCRTCAKNGKLQKEEVDMPNGCPLCPAQPATAAAAVAALAQAAAEAEAAAAMAKPKMARAAKRGKDDKGGKGSARVKDEQATADAKEEATKVAKKEVKKERRGKVSVKEEEATVAPSSKGAKRVRGAATGGTGQGVKVKVKSEPGADTEATAAKRVKTEPGQRAQPRRSGRATANSAGTAAFASC